MNFKKLTLAFMMVGLVTACSPKTPDCNDSDVKNLVIEIFKENILESRLFREDELWLFTERDYSITDVVIRQHDEKLDFYTCRAKLQGSFIKEDKIANESYRSQASQPLVIPITYTIESVDSGENFQVNIISFGK
ncbi:hypothetical protein ACFFHK_07255 [Gallibacterium trehalosifermentans]|uniref:Uncharacterized protein n=1 Tax=Gallibacterium trehalosifermentans TaxID=516935 RepID=A0ABV6H1L9_9PAST